MTLLHKISRSSARGIVHRRTPAIVRPFRFGDVVQDMLRPWWGPLMFVGPRGEGTSMCVYLGQADAAAARNARLPVGWWIVVLNEDLEHVE